jgi:hypothetical protein
MHRSAALVAFAAWVAGCNSPVCGPGTKEHQRADGQIECTPADGVVSTLDCDVDGGATLVAGKCISAISCGPNTKLENGECVGTGGMGMPHEPDPCGTPAATKFCVNGTVRHLVDNSFLSGETVRVWPVDPLKFLAAPGALATTACPGPQNPCLAPPYETSDTFIFEDLAVPAAGLVALAVGDAAGVSPQVLQLTGTGARVAAGQRYRVDTYITPKTLVETWKTQGGVDYPTVGAYIARFFLDTAPSANDLQATETMPAAGIQMLQGGAPEGRAKYFDADFMSLGAGTSTGTLGAAIVPGTGDQQILTFSGTGNTPGDKWEQHPGNTTAGVVFVVRFHPCVQNAMGMCMM